MTDKAPGGVDLGKRPDSGSLFPTKASRPSPWKRIGLFLVFVILLVGAVGTIATKRKPAPAVTASETSQPQDTQIGSMNDSIADQAPAEQAQPTAEVPNVREDARRKVCRSLAKEFVESASPTREQQRRTLMLFSVNQCNHGYLSDADAAKRGLTEAELKSMEEDQDSGPISAFDGTS